jgi:3-dehydroquinate dehydratase / shikimate dehydrogenase
MLPFMQEHGWGFWSVEELRKAKFFGFISLKKVDFSAHFTFAVEIGWRLAFDFRGHDYATERAEAALQYNFKN